MTPTLRGLLRSTIFSFGGLAAVLAPTITFGKTTLQVVRGSGEFQTIETAITLTKPEALIMQWSTDQPGVLRGTWQVTNVTARNTVVASGQVPPPQPGHFIRFTIKANAFLKAQPPGWPMKFNITIQPINQSKQPLGSASPAVVVSQVPPGPAPPPVNFGQSARFPSVEMVSYREKIGVVPQTQLHFAGAGVTLRVTNTAKQWTDPISLNLIDSSLLLRQSTPAVSVARLKPGASQTVTLHMDAILPAPQSQLPQEKQYKQWHQEYWDRCGVELRAVMNWNGPQAHKPMNDRSETNLAREGWGDYSRTLPNAPICDSKQCVNPCQMAKNIRKELDGNVVGYAFFAGQYPKFGASGEARTFADGASIDFAPNTKMTVASVSKLVTAIAAVRILDQNGVNIDSPIGPFLPSDWAPVSYVRNITFSQLLSHTSGIKDYGNVSQDYASLKKFFTQPVSNGTNTMCQPADIKNPSDSINPNNMTYCYSNYNFSIFRILLPKVAKLAEDSNPATRPRTLANQYVKLVQENVFDRVGQKDVACRPPNPLPNPFPVRTALGYRFPGKEKGHDWKDVSLQCGSAGWYLSVEDMAKVLLSINARDGKILAETAAKKQIDILGKAQFDMMRTRSLGWDIATNAELEKNGTWGADCDSNDKNCNMVSTSAAIFGPVTGPRVIGVLFINSDIAGGPSAGKGAQQVLEKAYNSALKPKP